VQIVRLHEQVDRGLDRLDSEFLSQVFRSRPSARQRGVINNAT
jgi:hypothetical protein